MDTIDNVRTVSLVQDDTPIAVSRALLAYINSNTGKPCVCNMEYLTADEGLALTVVQTPFILQRWIDGGYLAQYDFELIYRIIPSGNNSARLAADETLDTLAVWLVNHADQLTIDGVAVRKIERTNGASLLARYDTGAEDHAVNLTLRYERTV
jgi:hypothetical protein